MRLGLGLGINRGGAVSVLRIQPNATRAQWGLGAGTLSDGVATAETSRITYYAQEAIEKLQICYSNRISQTTQVANSITVKASIEYAGVLYPANFSGSRTKSFSVLETAFTDVVLMPTIPKGATFYVRTYVEVSSGQKWPRNFRYMNVSTEGLAAGVDYTDVLTACPTGGQLFGPIGVFGKRPSGSRCFAILGDSISMGFGVTSEGVGPFVAAFDGTATGTTYGKNVPYIHMGKSGERANQFELLAERGLRDDLLKYCTHAIYEYGINDVRGGAVTLAQIQASSQSIWSLLQSKGISRIYACTLTPNTTSTDAWATTANQTLANATGNTVRVAYNEWIRTIPAPLAGIIETADTCESSRNSGLWKPSHTSDGLHPNSTGFAAYKAAVNPNALT